MEPGSSMSHSQGLSNHQYIFEVLCDVSEQRWFLRSEVVSLTPTPKFEDHFWLPVHDCLVYLQLTSISGGYSPICNLRGRAMLTLSY